MDSRATLTCPSCGQTALKGPRGLHAHQLFHCPGKDGTPAPRKYSQFPPPVRVVQIGNVKPSELSSDDEQLISDHEECDSKIAPARRSSRVMASSRAKRKQPPPGNHQSERRSPVPLPPPPPRTALLPTLEPTDRRFVAFHRLLSTGHTIRGTRPLGNNTSDRHSLICRIQEDELEKRDTPGSFTAPHHRRSQSLQSTSTTESEKAHAAVALELSGLPVGNNRMSEIPDFLYEQDTDHSLDECPVGNCSQGGDSIDSEVDVPNTRSLDQPISLDQRSGLPGIPIPNLNDESWFSKTPAPVKEAELLQETTENKPTNFKRVQHLEPQERLFSRITSVLGKVACPLYVYDLIVDIFCDEVRNGGLCLDEHMNKRDTHLKNLRNKFRVSPPIAETVPMEASPRTSPDENMHSEPNRRNLTVYRFDPVELAKDHYGDNDIWGNWENLKGCVDPDDPFNQEKFIKENQNNDELMQTKWALDSWHECKRIVENSDNPNEPFLLNPKIVYLDGTGTDANCRFSIEPVVEMDGLINRSARNKDFTKRLLGYVPDVKKITTKATKSRLRSTFVGCGQNTRNLHACLRKIMDPYAATQGYEYAVRHTVRLHRHVRTVRLFRPVVFVQADGQAADYCSGRFLSSTEGVQRPCRSCDVPHDHLDDTNFRCTPTSYDEYEQLSLRCLKLFGQIPIDKSNPQDADIPCPRNNPVEFKKEMKETEAKFKAISRHPCILAFSNIHFGANKENIFGAHPVDPMHAFLHGLVSYSAKIYLAPLTDSELEALDRIIADNVSTIRSSELCAFPRISFAAGLTNLTLLTAEEWLGVLFVLVLVHQTDDGRHLFEAVYNRRLDDHEKLCRDTLKQQLGTDEDKELPSNTVCDPADFLYLAEMMLCFYAFYHNPASMNNWDVEVDCPRFDVAVRKMLSEIKTHLPRWKGQGWCIQKFHDIMDLVKWMLVFGSLMNFDCSNGERCLKFFAKLVAKTAQKCREDTFLKQASSRIMDFLVIRRAMSIIDPSGKDREKLVAVVDRSRTNTNASGLSRTQQRFRKNFDPTSHVGLEGTWAYSINLPTMTDPDQCLVEWSKSRKSVGEVHPVVLHEMLNKFGEMGVSSVNCFTEYTSKKGLRFRAHPNFFSCGPIYDSCLVFWEDDGSPAYAETSNGHYGLGQFPCKILCFYEHPLTLRAMALVHSCHKLHSKQGSVTTDVWELDYYLLRSSSQSKRLSLSLEDAGGVIDPRGNHTYQYRASACISRGSKSPAPASGAESVVRGGPPVQRYKPRLEHVQVESLGERLLMVEQEPGIVEQRVVQRYSSIRPQWKARGNNTRPRPLTVDGDLVRRIYNVPKDELVPGPKVIIAHSMDDWAAKFMLSTSKELENPECIE